DHNDPCGLTDAARESTTSFPKRCPAISCALAGIVTSIGPEAAVVHLVGDGRGFGIAVDLLSRHTGWDEAMVRTSRLLLIVGQVTIVVLAEPARAFQRRRVHAGPAGNPRECTLVADRNRGAELAGEGC